MELDLMILMDNSYQEYMKHMLWKHWIQNMDCNHLQDIELDLWILLDSNNQRGMLQLYW